MISDCRILGIEETDDAAAIKSAFRRRVKELHPDLARGEDALRKHALFVELCDAYNRLLGSRPTERGIRPRAGASSAPSAARTTGLVLHSDPAYAFYKAGMRIFMKIHPSQWNIDTNRMLNTKIAGQEDDQEIIKRKVLGLVEQFPKAYYYFGLVVHEYPESDWAFDAREKMNMIEERIGRYKRIIESFSSWNADEKRAIREYREKYDKSNETLKAARRDEPKGWKE
jgi:hypothetical protein